MEPISLVIGILAGALIGALIVWLALQSRYVRLRTTLEAERTLSVERLQDYKGFHDESLLRLTETFDSIAADALSKNNESFLRLANENLSTRLVEARGDLDRRRQAIDELVKPLSDGLAKMEKGRLQDYGSLKQLVEGMSKSQNQLSKETQNLTQALRAPQVRGRWGEMTLRRVVELAGMVSRCDFFEQYSLGGDGDNKRPDMVVHLPNDRLIAVDAKTPLDAYLNAIESTDDEDREAALKNHARQMGDRVRELAKKSYWSSMGDTPEFVVMFLPGEFLLAPALEKNPELLERAMSQGIIIATPTTLISLLHAVAYGWKEQQLTENAKEISRLGQEMYDRLAVWADHMVKLRQSLQRSVETFNESVGSLEHRVLVTARRFKESGISTDKEIPLLEPIDRTLRTVSMDTDEEVLNALSDENQRQASA